MEIKTLENELNSLAYHGRGIIIGKSTDGKKAITAYFIMGRSENSRNRVFVETEDGIRTQAFDPSKLVDPSLIIYAPVRVLGNTTIVTNGDQTDTIWEHMMMGKSFEDALRTREFEPDGPNWTPRISGIVYPDNTFKMSILKSDNGSDAQCVRNFFEYSAPITGQGRLIHTYKENGTPIPSFEGEPKVFEIGGDIDTFTETVWNALNPDNKVSLFVRYISLADRSVQTRIVNKNV